MPSTVYEASKSMEKLLIHYHYKYDIFRREKRDHKLYQFNNILEDYLTMSQVSVREGVSSQDLDEVLTLVEFHLNYLRHISKLFSFMKIRDVKVLKDARRKILVMEKTLIEQKFGPEKAKVAQRRKRINTYCEDLTYATSYPLKYINSSQYPSGDTEPEMRPEIDKWIKELLNANRDSFDPSKYDSAIMKMWEADLDYRNTATFRVTISPTEVEMYNHELVVCLMIDRLYIYEFTDMPESLSLLSRALTLSRLLVSQTELKTIRDYFRRRVERLSDVLPAERSHM